ncbi:Maf family nucleotide pyrophosphatase [Carboxylicivirga caseinilyticus]|uniref:Maf family nucleotide pyrophosphatase n=1 Tax=Carboxylicivirga caseinilyticus TaxID=3417572 RepID=UPI003D34F02E|nr:septum formation protein Maf [Marinilabiliaceae bacterium A049]
MLNKKLKDFKLILASQSPRRQELVKHLDIPFEVVIKEDVEEVYPLDLKPHDVPVFLAELKAKPYEDDINNYPWILVTADTIVLCENEILGKPTDKADAIRMLQMLSGKSHEVITGVCLSSNTRKHTFSVSTKVFFKQLTEEEITYYIDTYKPYDKAGAYGIQEWIGMVGIEKIEGSYFNVVGLPVQALYNELLKF